MGKFGHFDFDIDIISIQYNTNKSQWDTFEFTSQISLTELSCIDMQLL